MTPDDDQQFVAFSRAAGDVINEAAKAARKLPAAENLDHEDVHIAIACSCLRAAASAIAAIPEAEIFQFKKFLENLFAELRRRDGTVAGKARRQ